VMRRVIMLCVCVCVCGVDAVLSVYHVISLACGRSPVRACGTGTLSFRCSSCVSGRSLFVANGRVNLGGCNRACVMGVAYVIKVVRFLKAC
jgi:hypothetical protein